MIVCRSCLKVDKTMKNIFHEANGRLPKMIKDCTSIKVIENDGLPECLCIECMDKLTAAFEFREFFKNNDQALRAHLNVSVKLDQDEENEASFITQTIDVMITPNENTVAEQIDNISEDNESEVEEKLKYKCNKCTMSFNSPRGLSSHKAKAHEEEDPDFDPEVLIQKNKSYKCSHCDMKFSRQHLLMKHQRETHLEVSLEENDDIKMEVEEDDDDDDDDEFYEDDFDEDEEDEPKDSVKKEYSCEFCNKVLTTEIGLKVHTRTHTGKNLYECTECDKSFQKHRQLKCHMKTHESGTANQGEKTSGGKKEMQCEFCERKFKYKKSFTQHMSIEHGIDVDEDDLIVEPIVKRRRRKLKEESFSDSDSNDDKKLHAVHKCIVCNEEFGRSIELTRHMQVHRDLMTFKCEKCEDAFLTDEELQKHLARHATKPYNCHACARAFCRGEQYIHHIKTHDPPEEGKHFQCPICNEQYSEIDGLAEHVKVHIANDKKHICNTCGKAFPRGDLLRSHLKVHTGEAQVPKLHLCIYCGKEFNNSSNMIVHMRRHTGERPYKCKQCGKGFPRSHDLKCHERTHSGEKPYLCTLCGKSFNKSNKLLRHTRVHTGERPYVCTICGRAFTQSNDLALHMRRHTGARPYACGVCPARFIQSGQLKAHQRSKGHWVETAPDLKGSYRVEPVISTGESKPIRFRRTASGHKYQPPDFSEKPPPLLENQLQPSVENAPEQANVHQQQLQQQSSQLHMLLTQDPLDASKKPTATKPMTTAILNNTLHLAPVLSTHPNSTQNMEYVHAPPPPGYHDYGKVQSESIVVPMHSHTPTSTTGTFHEESIACSENSNTFSPTDASSYECRSYS